MKKFSRWGLMGIALVAAVFVLSGLSGSATAKGEKEVTIVNAYCPLMGTAMGKTAPENMTRMYKEKRIGFCCDKCLKEWDAMNDADREKKFQEAMAKAKPAEKK
jgi:hypothetical protein